MKVSKPMFKLACIAAWFGVAAGAAQAADLLDTVKQAGVLKIAMEGTYPPSIRVTPAATWSVSTSTSPRRWRLAWA